MNRKATCMHQAPSNEQWGAELATDRQKKKLRFFRVRLVKGLTKAEASAMIDAAETAQPEREEAYQAAKEEEEKLWFLDETINDADAREMGDYRKLTKAQLKELLAYLAQHALQWEHMERMRLVTVVRSLFPEQIKARRVSRGRRCRMAGPGGCVVLFIVLVALGFLLIILHRP